MFKQLIRLRRALLVFLASLTIYAVIYFYGTASVYSLVKTSARNGSSGATDLTFAAHSYLHPQNLTAASIAPVQRHADGGNSSDTVSPLTTRGTPDTTPKEIATVELQTAKTVSKEILAPVNSAIPYSRYMVDLNDASYYDEFLKTIMENKIGCQNASSYDAIMVVHSAPDKMTARQNYRWLYADLNKTYPYKLKVLFFLGKVINSTLQSALVSENDKYGDLVQGNFIDSYRNLTYKAIFSFKWLNDRCAGFRRLIRLDDDVFVRIGHFFQVWNTRVTKEENTIMCDAFFNDRVWRTGNWPVDKSDISEDTYNFQHCMGYFVALTPDLVLKMEAAAKRTRFFWIDDIFMYGFVAKKVGAKFENVIRDMARWDEKGFATCLTNPDRKCNFLAVMTRSDHFQMFYSLMQNNTAH